MLVFSFRALGLLAVLLPALSGCVAAPVPTVGSVVVVPPGELVSLATVYWIRRNPCSSRLNQVEGFSVTSGSTQGLDLSLQRGVAATPWQCPEMTVPGARIVARQTGQVAAAETRNIAFVVTYDTMDGPQTSRHMVQVSLVPRAR